MIRHPSFIDSTYVQIGLCRAQDLKYQYRVSYRTLRIPIHIEYRRKHFKKLRNEGNANQTNEFFYETSGLDRINTNTLLGMITYRMVGEPSPS